jgi:hypothetical protein
LGTRTLLACSVALFFFAAEARAGTTAFTFQGRLNDSGTPANGSYDMQLKLFDNATVGSGIQVGSTITRPGVKVTGGVFTVELDFTANAFPGADRFLEVGIKPAGSGNPFTILGPRQPITPTPYALHSLDATAATTATNATNATNATHATNATNATTATNATELNGVAASQYVLTSDSRLADSRAPTPGSTNYIQNTTSTQSADFNISGNGTISGGLTTGSNIGVGTTAPLAPLDVRGNVFIGLTGDPGPAGANALFLANDFGDSLNSFRIDGANDNLYIIGRSNPGATNDTGIIFRTATKGKQETDQVRIDGAGNMGIGTDSPQSKLDVRGDVKLGSTGQFFAPAGEDKQRIIHGTIEFNAKSEPVIFSGGGFTITSSNAGVFYVTFNTPFTSIPSVTVTANRIGTTNVVVAMIDSDCGCDRFAQVKIVVLAGTQGVDFPFTFIAVGTR